MTTDYENQADPWEKCSQHPCTCSKPPLKRSKRDWLCLIVYMLCLLIPTIVLLTIYQVQHPSSMWSRYKSQEAGLSYVIFLSSSISKQLSLPLSVFLLSCLLMFLCQLSSPLCISSCAECYWSRAWGNSRKFFMQFLWALKRPDQETSKNHVSLAVSDKTSLL